LLTILIITTLFLFTFPTQAAKEKSRVWIVDDDGLADFKRIQDAINAASPGDEIFVEKGKYIESVTINKPIKLFGKDKNNTIIDGNGQTVITITADGCCIQGFKIINGGHYWSFWPAAGIWIKSNGNIIKGNVIEGNRVGIALSDSNYNIIEGNIIRFNDNDGISLGDSLSQGSHNNEISKNEIVSNGEYGIGAWRSSHNKITANHVEKNGYKWGGKGIYLSSSSNNFIYLNNFVDNWDNVYTLGSTNTWHSPDNVTYFYEGRNFKGYLGNYWSDHKAKDLDGNGIADFPYSINGDKDYFPLMKPFESYLLPSSENHFPSSSTLSLYDQQSFDIKNRLGNAFLISFGKKEFYQNFDAIKGHLLFSEEVITGWGVFKEWATYGIKEALPVPIPEEYIRDFIEGRFGEIPKESRTLIEEGIKKLGEKGFEFVLKEAMTKEMAKELLRESARARGMSEEIAERTSTELAEVLVAKEATRAASILAKAIFAVIDMKKPLDKTFDWAFGSSRIRWREITNILRLACLTAESQNHVNFIARKEQYGFIIYLVSYEYYYSEPVYISSPKVDKLPEKAIPYEIGTYTQIPPIFGESRL
jgi:parallel beta-helix repeat protein